MHIQGFSIQCRIQDSEKHILSLCFKKIIIVLFVDAVPFAFDVLL